MEQRKVSKKKNFESIVLSVKLRTGCYRHIKISTDVSLDYLA